MSEHKGTSIFKRLSPGYFCFGLEITGRTFVQFTKDTYDIMTTPTLVLYLGWWVIDIPWGEPRKQIPKWVIS